MPILTLIAGPGKRVCVSAYVNVVYTRTPMHGGRQGSKAALHKEILDLTHKTKPTKNFYSDLGTLSSLLAGQAGPDDAVPRQVN